MADNPVLFLDVDGPINSTRPGEKIWNRHWVEDVVMGFVLRYNPILIDRIRDLINDNIEVTWCSTWAPYADLLEEVFSLPQMPRAFDECSYSVWTQKVQAVEKFDQTTERRWAWIDDEAPRNGPVRDALLASGRGLIIRADPYTGITPADIHQVKHHLSGIEALEV